GVMGAVAILVLATPWMVPRAALQVWGAWGPVWGPGMAAPTVVGSAIVAWGVACWSGERRRRGRAGADLWVWAAAVLLLTGGPIVVGLFVRYFGFRAVGPLAPGTTVLGGLATLTGLVLSRDMELE